MANAETSERWHRIRAFRLDADGVALSFSSRLAREQGWTHAYAARVIDEYKRFVFLALEAGHPVTPSEDVDQAWHLHLTYTRSYWQHFCSETLGRDLHHEPTRGGSDEGTKFRDWYGRTLDSYRGIFQQDPPGDVWPSPAERFAHAGSSRWIDLSRVWIIPRPRWFFRLFFDKNP